MGAQVAGTAELCPGARTPVSQVLQGHMPPQLSLSIPIP